MKKEKKGGRGQKSDPGEGLSLLFKVYIMQMTKGEEGEIAFSLPRPSYFPPSSQPEEGAKLIHSLMNTKLPLFSRLLERALF